MDWDLQVAAIIMGGDDDFEADTPLMEVRSHFWGKKKRVKVAEKTALYKSSTIAKHLISQFLFVRSQ